MTSICILAQCLFFIYSTNNYLLTIVLRFPCYIFAIIVIIVIICYLCKIQTIFYCCYLLQITVMWVSFMYKRLIVTVDTVVYLC